MSPAPSPNTLLALFRRQSWEVRLLVLLGLALVASGLFHVVVWLVQGAPSLAGPVTWRKPIVFGLSTGVTTLSIAWIVSLLPASAGRRRWSLVYAVPMALEIVLIDLQQWRGVGSHFNVTTLLDNIIFFTMGGLILTSAAATVAFMLRLWRARDVAADQRAAALGGLVLLQLATIVGIGMVVHGQIVLEAHAGIPAVVAGRGLLKVPHGVALHGLQILPLLAWLLARARVSAAEGTAWIWATTAGLFLLVLAALFGALAGRAPLDPPLFAAALAVCGLVLLVATAGRLLAASVQSGSARVPSEAP